MIPCGGYIDHVWINGWRDEMERSVHTATVLAVIAFGAVSVWRQIMDAEAIIEIRELARQQAPQAIQELSRLALDARSESVRITAIRELLDRAYGKPAPSGQAALSVRARAGP